MTKVGYGCSPPRSNPEEKGRGFPRPSSINFAVRSGADFGGVDLHARPHRRRQGDLADIFALGARRLRLDDRVDEGVEVLAKLLLAERQLAQTGMDDARLFEAELDLAAPGPLDGFGDLRGDGTELRVRDQALR